MKYLIVTLMLIGLSISPRSSHAINFEQIICDEQPDPELCRTIAQWYARVRQPKSANYSDGNSSSCCGVGDAYWVDQIDKITDQGVFATITDNRDIMNRIPRNGRHIFIPNEKLDDKFQGNPTGHNVVFLGGDGGLQRFNYPDIEPNFPYVFCAFLLFNG